MWRTCYFRTCASSGASASQEFAVFVRAIRFGLQHVLRVVQVYLVVGMRGLVSLGIRMRGLVSDRIFLCCVRYWCISWNCVCVLFMYFLTFVDRKHHEEPQTLPTNPHKINIREVWWARESWKKYRKSLTCGERQIQHLVRIACICVYNGR